MSNIQIRIFPDGRVQGEVHGIKGKKCTDYIGMIEDLTESRTFSSNYTEEFYETDPILLHQEQTEDDADLLLGEVPYGR